MGPPVDGGAVSPSLAQDGTPTATPFPLTPSAFNYLPHIAHNPSPADTRTPVPSTLTPTSAPPTPTATEAPSTTLTIQGAVQSCQGVFMTGATVTLEGTGQSATTGGDGRYRIGPLANFLGGDYVLTAAAAGYAPRSLPLTLPDTGVRTVNFAGASCLSPAPTATPTATMISPIIFFDDVENGNQGWIVQHSGNNADWQIVDYDGQSQPHSWFAMSSSTPSDIYLISAPITLQPNAVLAFWHRYILEANDTFGLDGGVVELSNDGGTTWQDLGLLMTQNGYNTIISSSFGSPIPARRAFSGNSRGWLQTRVDLSNYNGQTVRLRFRLANDSSDGWDGWWIDNVTVGSASAISIPTPKPTIALNWSQAGSLAIERHGLAAVSIGDGQIYALGGSDSYGRYLSITEKYDVTTNVWRRVADMLTARTSLAAAQINGKIYAIGGSTNYTGTDAVEEYDPISDRWQARAKLPRPITRMGAATVNGKVYVVGGVTVGDGRLVILSTVYEYNPESDSWIEKAPLPAPRVDLVTVATSNGKIYAVGGSPTVSSSDVVYTVFEYDVARNVWRRRANTLGAHISFGGIASRNGKIYIVGSFSSRTGEVEEYDPITNSWTAAFPLSQQRSLHTVVDSGGRIYVIGGDIFNLTNQVDVATLP